MNFAQNLKRLRIAAGLTQEQLAHACGYSGQSRIGNYESSQPKARQPKPDELPVIAQALGVTVGQLFGEAAPNLNSQLMRLDPDTLAETARTLRERFDDEATVCRLIENQPQLFIRAYELYANRTTDERSPEMDRSLAMKIADLTPQGAKKDERGKTVSTEGSAQRRVGSGRKRKA